ncbi:MAG: hypothetical protein ABUK01_09335 [Leptospirales bacterium]
MKTTILLILVFTQLDYVSSLTLSTQNGVDNGKKITINNSDKMTELLKYVEQNLVVLYEILQRNRVLAVKAANGIYTPRQRGNFNQSFQEMFKEAARTIRRAKYNNYPLLEFTNQKWAAHLVLKLDRKDEPVVYSLPRIYSQNYGYDSWSHNEKIGWPNVKTTWEASAALGDIDKALGQLDSELTLVRAVIQRLNIAKKVDHKIK